MQFESGVTVSLSMVATTKDICVRKTRIFGSHGELDCDGAVIRHTIFSDLTTREIHPEKAPVQSRLQGHDGADYWMMKGFVEAVKGALVSGKVDEGLSNPEDTLQSHLICFKAEQSRKQGEVVIM